MLRPFFSYYGAKWRLAPSYPEPFYGLLIEPFAGSAGYSLRYPYNDVCLYDVDEKIVGTWRYLIKATEREIRALPLIRPHDRVSDLRVPQEARWLIGWWLNKATNAPKNRPSQWMRNGSTGRQENFWGEGIRERIASQLASIRHWKVDLLTYARVPDRPATWFVDPPYIGSAGSHYTNGNTQINYGHLANWCRSRTGQVLVCENEGARWLPFEYLTSSKATAGGTRTGVSHEVLWQSYNPPKELR